MLKRALLYILLSFYCFQVQACTPVPESLLDLVKEREVALFGEYHGTNEMLERFFDLVCSLISKTEKPLVIAIELQSTTQMTQALAVENELDFSEEKQWQSAHDGKTSLAMFKLIEKLRFLQRNEQLQLVFFDSASDERDRVMAQKIRNAQLDNPNTITLVLTGNVHAKLTQGAFWDPDWTNMGEVLVEMGAKPLSIYFTSSGGEAWVCKDKCGVYSVSPWKNESQSEFYSAKEGSGYDYFWYIGRITASNPAYP